MIYHQALCSLCNDVVGCGAAIEAWSYVTIGWLARRIDDGSRNARWVFIVRSNNVKTTSIILAASQCGDNNHQCKYVFQISVSVRVVLSHEG